jgi:hypothetical protein
MVLTLEDLAYITGVSGRGSGNRYKALAQKMRKKIHATFFDNEKRLYYTYATAKERRHFSEYNQALAILSGVAGKSLPGEIAVSIQAKRDMQPCSLFNKIYSYEAMLIVSSAYLPFIREDIKKTWAPMLYGGATTFWETEKGGSDFNGAGSLCHGWSALPVYIYKKYLGL